MRKVSPADSSNAPTRGSRVGLKGYYRRLAGATLAVGVLGAMTWPVVDLAEQSPPSAPTNGPVLADGVTLANLLIMGPKSVTVGQTAQYTATATYSDGSAVSLTTGPAWSISNSTLATITQAGVLTSLATGTVTVQAVYWTSPTATVSVATVMDPSWVSIYPGTNIQNLVNSYPGDTTFYLRAGTHVQQQVVPESGNTFIGETGAVMDGTNVTNYAFYSNNLNQTNVTIKKVEIKNYTTPLAWFGAITGDNVSNWVVTDNVVHHNAQAGIRAGTGTGWQVLRNTVYANGKAGIGGYRCDGAVFEGNEVYGNNPTNSTTEPALSGEAGIKVFRAADVIFRANNVHDNYGKGIWSDTNYPTILIENNTVSNNSGAGIWHEIGYAAVIRNNIVVGNGQPLLSGGWLVDRAGIQVTNSANVEIYGNMVLDNRSGITGMAADNVAYPSNGPHGTLRSAKPVRPRQHYSGPCRGDWEDWDRLAVGQHDILLVAE